MNVTFLQPWALLLLLLLPFFVLLVRRRMARFPTWTRRVALGARVALAALFVVCLFVIYGAGASPFLYFQF